MGRPGWGAGGLGGKQLERDMNNNFSSPLKLESHVLILLLSCKTVNLEPSFLGHFLCSYANSPPPSVYAMFNI